MSSQRVFACFFFLGLFRTLDLFDSVDIVRYPRFASLMTIVPRCSTLTFFAGIFSWMESVTVIIPLGFWDVLPKLERWTSRSPGAFQWHRISPPKKRWDTFRPGSGGVYSPRPRWSWHPSYGMQLGILDDLTEKILGRSRWKSKGVQGFYDFAASSRSQLLGFFMVFYTFWLGHIF